MTSDPEAALIRAYEKTISRLDMQVVALRVLLRNLRAVVSGTKTKEEMQQIIGEVDSVIE